MKKKKFIERVLNDVLEYGYGFLAVFIVSALSLAGLLAFPILYKVSFQYVLTLFTALAVGTLFGDTMFHLIPFVCNLIGRKTEVRIIFLFSRHWVFMVIMMNIIIPRFLYRIMSGKC
jgi:hypothetical protein